MRFILSNTTEAGIVFDAACKADDAPPASFPAKLTAFLRERWKRNGKGFVILSCELIDHNGDELKRCVLEYCKLWGLENDFAAWVERENLFCSTLVDRIVTGSPKAELPALWEKLGGVTIGLHLGAEDSSIDADLPEGRTHLTEEEIRLLEDTVNARIRADAPIRCWFPTAEELETLPLRKKPTVSEHIRVVAMGDFEMVACGGTHPASTGRIGLVKITSVIPAKGKARITFVCGGRAVRLFQTYMRCADKAGAALSCPVEKLSRAASDLKSRLAEAERKARVFETADILRKIQAAETAEDLPGITLAALTMEETDAKATAAAVSDYIAGKGKLLLLATGERLTFARSADVRIDMNGLIKRVGRGGGRPDMASGAGIPECVGVARKILMHEYRG